VCRDCHAHRQSHVVLRAYYRKSSKESVNEPVTELTSCFVSVTIYRGGARGHPDGGQRSRRGGLMAFSVFDDTIRHAMYSFPYSFRTSVGWGGAISRQHFPPTPSSYCRLSVVKGCRGYHRENFEKFSQNYAFWCIFSGFEQLF